MYSMTGYGKSRLDLPIGSLQIEIKSVNHRFKDFNLRLPSQLMAWDLQIRRLLGENISRGRVDLNITIEASAAMVSKPVLNSELAKGYLDVLREINGLIGVGDPPSAEMLLNFRDIISYEEALPENIWDDLKAGIEKATDELKQSRLAEGKTIERDMAKRLGLIGQYIEKIAELSTGMIDTYRDKLTKRMEALLNGVNVDEARLLQEAAFLADRADITEELVRIRSHINEFSSAMNLNEQVGKKLEFFTQEFVREINTIASKTTEKDIISLAVEVKTEIEKIREQVQNIE